MKRFIALILVASVLLGCTAHRVKTAYLRDTLFSVEETENGYWRIWMTHDDIAGYCTQDVELGQSALTLLQEHSGEVVVEFRDIKGLSDAEFSWWDNSDCGSIYTGDSSTKMFLFTDVYAVGSR